MTMEVKYANSWNDPPPRPKLAQALIDSGCDVISQHSDSTAPATTAEQNGVWTWATTPIRSPPPQRLSDLLPH